MGTLGQALAPLVAHSVEGQRGAGATRCVTLENTARRPSTLLSQSCLSEIL